MRTLGGATVALVLSVMSGPARAGEGDLDPTFGNGGAVITDFATTDDYAYSVAMQPDSMAARGTTSQRVFMASTRR